MKRVALAAMGLLAIVVVSGASFEAVMRHRAARDYPPPGRLVDVGGRRLQIDCRGSGSPTARTGAQLAPFREATGKSMQPPTAAVADVVSRAYLPTSIEALRREADAIGATLDAAGRVRGLGARPLVVLTATAKTSPAMLAASGLTRAQGDRMEAVWETLQADEATWSIGGRHERVPNASHYIQFDRPDVVIGAVRDVVARVRGTRGTSPQ